MQLFIVVCLAALAFAANACQENAHYSSCGSACPLTCENYRNPPKACVLMCVPGCHCDDGYVKTKDGRCVLPDDCPATSNDGCGENAEFRSCGTACPLTCDNYKNPPKICTANCVPECQCKTGYVRALDGRCVTPEQCPESTRSANVDCGENEEFRSCGTACPLTCKNYKNPPKICTLNCVPECQCKTGYVRALDGRCVAPEQCPESPRSEVNECLQEPDGGMCRGYFPMFYYDAKTGTCKEFIYGGCQGNGNRFGSEEECQQKCGDVKVWDSSAVCSKPLETGPCRALFHRYGFDAAAGKCKKFVYGGCGGNENNFETLDECRTTCLSDFQLKRPDCDMDADPGLCKAYFKRFHYEDGQCKEFVYGGCGGNKNNFKTEEECYNQCGALAAPTLCYQDKEVGPCKAAFKRYYFNKETKECEPFTYGGCQGNDNNFLQQEDCRRACIGV